MMVGGGDGLNAPRSVWAPPPRTPAPHRRAEESAPASAPSMFPVWLLLLAVLGFGFYFAAPLASAPTRS